MLRFFGLGVALATLLVTGAKAQFDSVLFTEDFNGVTLLDSVNERLGTVLVTREASDLDSTPIAGVFSPTAPGWTVDNTLASFGGVPTIGNAGVPGAGVADYGVDEWEGWSFVNKDFWVAAAGEQDRELFSGASGSVAVVDPDEYFDLGGPSDETNGGYYNSSLKSAPIAVSAGLYSLSWVDSWRDEAFDDDHPSGLVGQNNQSIEVLAVFDVGAPATVASFNSDSADLANFRDDDPDGTQTQGFVVPAGATTVSLQFNIANAGNDWWYAIDNIDLSQVDLVGGGPNVSVWSEDFEGVTLGDSVNEREAFAKTTTESATPETVARPNSFTHTAPGGWTVDNSGLPNGVADDDNGVFEFEGWTFVSGDFWTFAEESGREEFTKGTGAFAVADSDEYDDLGPANANGPLDTILISPEMDITGVEEGRLALAFDSSWRPEGNQQALIEVNFGEGWIEALNWSSDDTLANFHDRNTNESVLQLLNNPAGATTAQVRFSYLGGSNNWFWAIDNVQVGVATVPEPSSVATLCLAALAAAGARRQRH